MDFRIEEWSADGERLVELLAEAGHVHVATAAWWAACAIRPSSTVRMRKGALVMREKRPHKPPVLQVARKPGARG